MHHNNHARSVQNAHNLIGKRIIVIGVGPMPPHHCNKVPEPTTLIIPPTHKLENGHKIRVRGEAGGWFAPDGSPIPPRLPNQRQKRKNNRRNYKH